MKKLNKNDYKALNYILNNKKLKKTELAKLLGISQAAIYKLANKLDSLNLLSYEKNSDKRSKYSLTINKDYKKIIGIYFSTNLLEITVSDLNYNIIETFSQKINSSFIQIEKIKKTISSKIEKMINLYGKENIIGIGISIQADINSDLDLMIYSELFSEKNICLKEYISNKFKLECVVENNIHAMHYTIDRLYNKNSNKVFYHNKKEVKGISIMIYNKIYKGKNFNMSRFKNMSNENIINYINFLDIDTVILNTDKEYRKDLINMLQCDSIVINKLKDIEKLSPITLIINNLFKNKTLIKL